jgi:ferrochelatase
MGRYLAEAKWPSDAAKPVGILLANLGTPAAPTAAAVRPYLREFLSDPRVVELPRALWLPLLYGVIVPLRARQSAAKYAEIWTDGGSPLLVYSRRQQQLLAGALGERLKAAGLPEDGVRLALAMRYGEPSIRSALAELKQAGCEKILVLPLYPQYAASTTGSVFDAVAKALTAMRYVPALRLAAPYHDDAGYIRAVAARILRHWQSNRRPDKLVMSFHGLPQFSVDRGDPYQEHCRQSARLLVRELGLADDEYALTFQSRFGRAQWLKPYTAATLEELARAGVKRVDVICPGFTADCLETLEEINLMCRKIFLDAGGREFHYIPALNDAPEWIAALAAIAGRELEGWIAAPPALSEDEARAARAKALGAVR